MPYQICNPCTAFEEIYFHILKLKCVDLEIVSVTFIDETFPLCMMPTF